MSLNLDDVDDYDPSMITKDTSNSSGTRSFDALNNIDDNDSSSSSSTTTASSSLSSLSTEESLDDFLSTLSVLDRQTEIIRIVSAFKLNPLDILNFPYSSCTMDTNQFSLLLQKHFRSLSLLVHPDKVSSEWRSRAENAFAIISKAKDDIINEGNREQLLMIIDDCRGKLRKQMMDEFQSKKRKITEGGSGGTGTGLSIQSELFNDGNEEFDRRLKDSVKQYLINREWKKRQALLQEKHEEEIKKKKETEEKQIKTIEKKEKDNWEKGRDDRVNTWRSFQKFGKKTSTTIKTTAPGKITTTNLTTIGGGMNGAANKW